MPALPPSFTPFAPSSSPSPFLRSSSPPSLSARGVKVAGGAWVGRNTFLSLMSDPSRPHSPHFPFPAPYTLHPAPCTLHRALTLRAVPLSSGYGTYNTVKATFWAWFSGSGFVFILALISRVLERSGFLLARLWKPRSEQKSIQNLKKMLTGSVAAAASYAPFADVSFDRR